MGDIQRIVAREAAMVGQVKAIGQLWAAEVAEGLGISDVRSVEFTMGEVEGIERRDDIAISGRFEPEAEARITVHGQIVGPRMPRKTKKAWRKYWDPNRDYPTLNEMRRIARLRWLPTGMDRNPK